MSKGANGCGRVSAQPMAARPCGQGRLQRWLADAVPCRANLTGADPHQGCPLETEDPPRVRTGWACRTHPSWGWGVLDPKPATAGCRSRACSAHALWVRAACVKQRYGITGCSQAPRPDNKTCGKVPTRVGRLHACDTEPSFAGLRAWHARGCLGMLFGAQPWVRREAPKGEPAQGEEDPALPRGSAALARAKRGAKPGEAGLQQCRWRDPMHAKLARGPLLCSYDPLRANKRAKYARMARMPCMLGCF